MVMSPGKQPIRIALVGAVAAGKTSLLGRLTSGAWSVELEQTSGVNFQLVTLDDERLHVWDVPGDPRYALISASSYFRSIQGAVLCFDTTRPDSLAEVSAWVDLLKQWGPAGVQMVLCGTKHEGLTDDLLAQRAAAFALTLGVPWVVCSAMTGSGVHEVFSMLVGRVRTSRQEFGLAQSSVGPLTEIQLTSENSNDIAGRPSLKPVTDSCQSVGVRLSTCPVVAATLGPCGVTCARLTRMASEAAAPRRQPSQAEGKHQTTLPSEAWMCERSNSGGVMLNLSQAPACKQQLRN